jgi:Na+-driven multidrug efflux pump
MLLVRRALIVNQANPLAWFLALHSGWGQSGVYWSILIAESLMAMAAMWVFKRGAWKKAKV